MRLTLRPPKQNNPTEIAAPKTKLQRLLRNRWFWVLVAVFVLATGATLYYRSVRNTIIVSGNNDTAGALSAGNATDLALSQLKKDGDSRVNILLLGKGGADHAGGNLTDSIQLLSIDIFSNKVSIVGIPRDLYTDSKTGKMKINAVYSTAEGKQKGTGGKAIKEVVGNVTDMTVHYFAVIDFAGMKDVVDALGGISVNVPKAIKDTEYPLDDGTDRYTTYQISAGVHKMSGDQALMYVRSRHSTSDFDRLARQQLVISAIKDKALSTGTISNPTKLTKLLKAVENNFRTDMTPKEMSALFDRVTKIQQSDISSMVLGNGGFGSTNLLESPKSSVLGSVQQPILGATNYTDVQRAWHKITVDPLVKKEAAKVRINYVSTKSKTTATDLSNLLKDYGYNVVSTNQTTDKITQNTVISYRGNSVRYSSNYLAQRLKTTVKNQRANDDNVDIDIQLP